MRRRDALYASGAVVVVGALLTFTVVAAIPALTGAGGGPSADARVTSLEPTAMVNDESIAEMNATDGVETCLTTGPGPDTTLVTGDAVIERTDSAVGERQFRVVVTAGDGAIRDEYELSLGRSGRERVILRASADGDALDPGERITVAVRVFTAGDRIAERTKAITVERAGQASCEESNFAAS